MANNRTEALASMRSVGGDRLNNAGSAQPFLDEYQTPHLATGFFLIAIATSVAVFVAGTMDSQIRLAGVAVVTVVTSMIIFWMIVAQPTIDTLAVARSQRAVDGARHDSMRQDLQLVVAEKEQGTNRVGRLGRILAATQQQLSREITMMGFAVENLVEASQDGDVGSDVVDQLKTALDHVEEGQRNVSALSRLGTSDRTKRIVGFRASDVVPLTVDAALSVERDDLIYGDVDLWRLFVKNAARNAESHGQAGVFTMSSGDGRLTMSDDGTGCTSEILQQAWKAGLRPNGTRSDGTQIMRRIADAHQAFVTMQGEPDVGVRIVVDLRDLETDLRDRGVVAAPVRSMHKANGGRTSSASQPGNS